MIKKQAVVVTPQRDTVGKWISTILLQWEFVFVDDYTTMTKKRGTRPLDFQQNSLIHIYYNMIYAVP